MPSRTSQGIFSRFEYSPDTFVVSHSGMHPCTAKQMQAGSVSPVISSLLTVCGGRVISYFEPHSRHLLNVYHVLFLTQVAFPSVSPFSQPYAAGAAVTLIRQVRRLRPRVKITQPRRFGELASCRA